MIVSSRHLVTMPRLLMLKRVTPFCKASGKSQLSFVERSSVPRIALLCPSARTGVRIPTRQNLSSSPRLSLTSLSQHMQFSNAALPLKNEAAETSSLPTFEEIGLSDELLAAVNDLELTNPTEIQALGIPEVLQGGDILLGSQTGSGKTLAYLLPVIQQLRYDEVEKELVTRPKRPRAVILVPTRELSEQVLSVAKSISHFARFRSTCILGGGKWKQQESALAQKVDVIVSTPGRLLQHVDKGNVFLGDMRYLVMDEADTMFESGFGKDMKRFLGALKKPGKPSQCILVAATVSKPVRRILEFELPTMRAVNAKSLHKAATKAKHNFIRVPGNMNKLEFLRQVIDMENKKQKRTMIFCNTLDSCRAVEHTLNEFGCRTVTYHGEMPKDQRKESFNVFMEEDSAQVPLMVCTDLAARGLDFHQGVHHVVNFDFPLNSVDYMHRSGRTARAGASGNVTSLVDKRAETLAHQIHSRIQQGGTLDDVANNRTELKKRKSIELKKARTLKMAEARKAELRQKRLGKKFGGRGSEGASGRGSRGGRGGKGGSASGRMSYSAARGGRGSG